VIIYIDLKVFILFYLFQNFFSNFMERPQRIRKPNSRYDPNIYILASFPKHQVTIDPIKEQNGTVRSSGFVQPVGIIAEGKLIFIFSTLKIFFGIGSRDTGSEDERIDDGDVYPVEDYSKKENNQSFITTSGKKILS